MEYLVDAKWLNEQINLKQENLIIVDVRFNLMDAEAGEKAFEEGHIPGAIYIHLDKDLSETPGKHGGRHPLPAANEFARKIGELGIGNETQVIVYDDQDGVFASRFWWMMKHVGHQHVAILNGGYKKWLEANYPVTTDVQSYPARVFTAQEAEGWETVDAQAVKARLDDDNTVLIDARDHKRYLGLTETIDPIGGHIPGATNVFWKNVTTKDGFWKDDEKLKEVFAHIPRSKEVIVYCGSGVSACPNVLALKKAGYENVKLYPGSWSDWITHEDYPIETSEER